MSKFNRIENFKMSFENKCIQLFVEAYNKSIAEKSIKPNWNENDITNQIHEYIDKSSLRTKFSIVTNVEHHLPNNMIKKNKGFADRDLRIDLRFVKFNSEKEYRIFFEAKNLKEKDSALKRRYIDTGINNFVCKKYPHGFLVGYLLEGEVCRTIVGINRLLKNDGKANECLCNKKHEIVRHYYESNHSNLCLKHLIFDFTKIH